MWIGYEYVKANMSKYIDHIIILTHLWPWICLGKDKGILVIVDILYMWACIIHELVCYFYMFYMYGNVVDTSGLDTMAWIASAEVKHYFTLFYIS